VGKEVDEGAHLEGEVLAGRIDGIDTDRRGLGIAE